MSHQDSPSTTSLTDVPEISGTPSNVSSNLGDAVWEWFHFVDGRYTCILTKSINTVDGQEVTAPCTMSYKGEVAIVDFCFYHRPKVLVKAPLTAPLYEYFAEAQPRQNTSIIVQ